ncbi:MAG TPA: hypothetical protein VN932_00305 [Rhizomicrobium sp.]|nr:hypothetical protein [Rhizomicrobium sp.]
MKHFAIAAFTALLCAAPAFGQTGNICIRTTDIDRTSVPDANTILFHMRDGRVLKNTLANACPELKFNGFEYVSQPPGQICGNMQSIRVIHSGAVCLLGPFTTVAPAKRSGM